MKPRDTALRFKQFEVEEKVRKVADLEAMIRDFEGMASDLERQIRTEEERTGIRDITHYAYSTFAKSAAQRRDNLMASVSGLRAKLEAALQERDEATSQLTRVNSGEAKDEPRSRRRSDRTHGASYR